VFGGRLAQAALRQHVELVGSDTDPILPWRDFEFKGLAQ
jgi:hypothetical protein